MPEGGTHRSIVITGASSGIGRALALHYSKAGVTLGLIGRHSGRLADCAAACRQRGAATVTSCIDVTDRAAIATWLAAYDQDHPIDLLFVNAGVSSGLQPGGIFEPSPAAFRVFDVNVGGAVNTAIPVVDSMLRRGHGQIAFLSSLASFFPLPSTPSYSASKAAIRYYGLALRQAVRKHGVKVSVICPGYVISPMSERVIGRKPLLMPAEQAVEFIARNLEDDKPLIAFPRLLAFGIKLLHLLPPSLALYFSQAFALRVRSDEGVTSTSSP